MLREGTSAKSYSESPNILNRIDIVKEKSIQENSDQLHTTQTNFHNNNITDNIHKNNNFIKALEVMRLNKVEVKKLTSHNSSCINSDTERNVLEFSITNANLSKEENIAKYLNNPVVKSMEIINNNIRKRKKLNHNSFSARTPYQMDIFIRPFLDVLKMEAIEEREECDDREIEGVKVADANINQHINKGVVFAKYSNEEEFYDSLDRYALSNGGGRERLANDGYSDERFFQNLKKFSSTENNSNSNLNKSFENERNSSQIVKDLLQESQLEEDSLCINNFKSKCDKLIEHQFNVKKRLPQRIKPKDSRVTPVTNANRKVTTERNSNMNSNTLKNNMTNAHTNTNTNTFTISSKPQISEAELNLDDLDQVKEINIVEYQIKLDSMNKNRIHKKNLNVSELDIFKNYNVGEDFSQSSDYFHSSNRNHNNNYKNSKILIVDSDIYSADSINRNSLCDLDQMKKDKREKTKKFLNNDKKKNLNQKEAGKNKVHIYSSSININNVYNVNLNNKNMSKSRENRMINSSNKKTVRRKYYKSEIFESHGKALDNVYASNMLDRIDGMEITQENKSKIKKNLINKFNEIEVVVDKSFECLNLISSDEDNTIERDTTSRKGIRKITYEQSQANTEEIELCDIQTISEFDNVSCNRINFDPFQTPFDKVRKHNRIEDVLILVQIQTKEKAVLLDSENFEKSAQECLYRGRSLGNNTNFRENINYRTQKLNEYSSLKHSFTNYREKHFNDVEDSFADKVYDLDFVNNMLDREKVYKANPFNLYNHPKLDASHRTILIDWLMELCEEFAFKRDTFHYAVNYIDRFLSNSKDITKGSLQLIGVASLSIAAKFEEIQLPKTEEYINATDNTYSTAEFMKTERHIIQTLKWQIVPITINTWLNWYLFQWDLFVETIPGVKEAITSNKKDVIYFKKPDENYYFYYRQVTQLIDIFSIDHESLIIPDRFLIAAAIFLTICSIWEIEQFRKENLNKFDYDKDFFLGFIAQKELYVVKIFSQFLKESLNMEFDDPTLIVALKYSIMFIGLEFNYNLPLVIQSNNGDIVI